MNNGEIFIRNGFTKKERSVTGELKNCYEKFVEINDLYDMWVSYNLEEHKGFIYVEFECGGEVESYSFDTYCEDEEDCFYEIMAEVINKKNLYK